MTLRDNIGTFAKEDEAFDLLNRLSWQLPIFVIVSAILDLVLAFVYLKWLHPWKIILQEVSSKFSSCNLTLLNFQGARKLELCH